MTDPQTTNLADRAEAAGESETREVLIAAYAEIFGQEPSNDEWYGGSVEDRTRGRYFIAMLNCGAFESAALMLVPKGWSVLAAFNPTGRCKCDLSDGPMDGKDRHWVGAQPCATPALAIVAACLRAEAARRGGEGR